MMPKDPVDDFFENMGCLFLLAFSAAVLYVAFKAFVGYLTGIF